MSNELREVIREKYAAFITKKVSCCSSCGCDVPNSKADQAITGNLYDENDLAGLPFDAIQASLGCGNPTALASLNQGETVLDLGSGAGLDVLLSARRVGPTGKAYGLDMTDEMLAEARKNQEKSGITNVEFVKGHIEEMPFPDKLMDVIISNCVINLSVDKDKVLSEAFRVLKPGGRFAVSDIVLTKNLPKKVRMNLAAWSGCISGSLRDVDYREKLTSAGFENISITFTRVYDLSLEAGICTDLTADEYEQIKGSISGAFIQASKPVK